MVYEQGLIQGDQTGRPKNTVRVKPNFVDAVRDTWCIKSVVIYMFIQSAIVDHFSQVLLVKSKNV